MTTDPRVQRFHAEADAAKKELRRLAMEIAGHRVDMAEALRIPGSRIPMNSDVLPDIIWSVENGRTDIAARIIELLELFHGSLGSAKMMWERIEIEEHERAVRSMETGDLPEYLEEDDR